MTARRIFWLLLLLAILGAYNYRRAGLDALKVAYKFSKLHLTKEFVAEVRVNSNTILIYAEPINSRSLKILDLDQLQPIIKKTIRDYPLFMERHYPEILTNYPEINQGFPSKQEIVFILVTPDTYKYQSIIRRKDSSGHVGFPDTSTIYLKTYGDNYKVTAFKSVIRHEMFHYLNNYYGIPPEEFEEVAAQRSGSVN